MSGTTPDPASQQPFNAPENLPGMVPSNTPVPVPPSDIARQMPSAPVPAPTVSTTRGMYTAAAILNWVTLGIVAVATFGIGLIAAAWFVPMTILIHKGAKGPYKHTALGVCTLLFCNIISGILMLVDDSNRPPKPIG